MITEDDVFEFAQKCARAYCRRFNAWSRLDDAIGDACAYLLEHREKWSNSNGALTVRVVGELISSYQKEYGLLLKNSPKIVVGDMSRVEDSRKTNDDPRFEIMRRALRQPEIAPYAEIVEDIISLNYTRAEIAKKHGSTQSRLSQIFKTYKNVCRRLSEVQSVELANPDELDLTTKEKEKMELFYGSPRNQQTEPSAKRFGTDDG